MTHTLPLAFGGSIPAVGLGLWKVEKPDASGLVQTALKLGYRHLDAACDYGNEAEVGDGIHAALRAKTCRREELWVTSKLWNTYHARKHVRLAAERTLRDLKCDYLDLYLIHFPIPQQFVAFEDRYPPGWFTDPAAKPPRMMPASVSVAETWGAMEELVAAGLVKQIGISNFNVALIRDLLTHASIKPSVLQVELHPYLTQEKLLRFCQDNGVAVTGFSPLGAPSYVPLGMAKAEDSVLEQPVVKAAAKRLGKTPGQIVLRWGVQRGTSIVPKTSRPDRLAENLAIFDFELSAEEMQAISGLNSNRRFNDPGVFCELAFNTFFPIYE